MSEKQLAVIQKFKNIVFSSIAYFFAAFFGLFALVYAQKSLFSGVLFLLTGLFCLPFFQKQINNQMSKFTQKKIPAFAYIPVVFCLFLFSVSNTPTTKSEKNTNQNNQAQVKGVLESQNTSQKNSSSFSSSSSLNPELQKAQEEAKKQAELFSLEREKLEVEKQAQEEERKKIEEEKLKLEEEREIAQENAQTQENIKQEVAQISQNIVQNTFPKETKLQTNPEANNLLTNPQITTKPLEEIPVTNPQNVREQANFQINEALKFANCTEAKQAGYGGMTRGTPAYEKNPGLDRDKDGIACDK